MQRFDDGPGTGDEGENRGIRGEIEDKELEMNHYSNNCERRA